MVNRYRKGEREGKGWVDVTREKSFVRDGVPERRETRKTDPTRRGRSRLIEQK